MRALLVVAVLAAACMFVGANTASAADHGQVPTSMLAQMGLGGMQPMSDAQGLAIRGMGRRSNGGGGGGGGGTIQINAVVQISSNGNAGNGGAGGNGGGVDDCLATTNAVPVGGGGSGGNGGAVNGTTFNNNTAAFIQVNASRVRFGGIF